LQITQVLPAHSAEARRRCPPKSRDAPAARPPRLGAIVEGALPYIFTRPAAILAAMTVFFMSMVMVMGPTPPGTGVM
jgi:hypothetical protein